jgi:hypothetical protein
MNAPSAAAKEVCDSMKKRRVGDAAILDRPKVALFCSVRCSGILILGTFDHPANAALLAAGAKRMDALRLSNLAGANAGRG